MRTRPKDLGTRQETAVVRRAQGYGLIAERLAEGSVTDRGDIRIFTDTEWVGEVKDRMALNVHQALDKARAKSGAHSTFIVWRKMKRNSGSSRRVQDGPVIVALTLDRFLELLKESS